MKFFLARHAETTANTKTVILGGKQGGELSERGKRQAEALSKRLSKEKFLEVHASSSNRAVQTAEAVMKRQGCRLFLHDELMEIDMGELVGLSHEQCNEKHPNILAEIFRKPSMRIPGGESLLDVRSRAMPVIEKIAGKRGDPSVLVVGHNIANRVILATLIGLPLEEGKNIKQKNACISVLDLKPDFAQLYTLDNSIHAIK